MNTIAFNQQLAHQWIEAFNTKDLDGLLKLYAVDAVHYSPKLKLRQPETNGLIKGNTALRSWWADAFERLPTLQYHLKNLIIQEDQLLMEYLRQVEGDADMMVAEVLLIRDELIVESRVYHG